MLPSMIVLALALTATAWRSAQLRSRFRNPLGAAMLIPVRFGLAAIAWWAAWTVTAPVPPWVPLLAFLALVEWVGVTLHTELPTERHAAQPDRDAASCSAPDKSRESELLTSAR